MKKNFKLNNLDCANCAAKIENQLNKIKDVKASVSFMTQRLTFETAAENFEEVFEQVKTAIKKIDSDITVS